MKKFTKLMLAAAAVTAVSAAMAVSTLAADTITGSYNAEDGVVTLKGVESSGEQQTLLVLSEDTDVTDANAGEIIKQIDQDASIASFKLKPGLTEGTYYIRMGGSNGTIQTGTLTIGGSSAETITLIVGDCNLDNELTSTDATNLARQQAKLTSRIGSVGTEYTKADGTGTFIVGDCNLDGELTSTDATNIARQQAKLTSRIGNVGESVQVEKK